MVYTARIDVAPMTHVILVAFLSASFVIGSIILGQTGPEMSISDKLSSYSCPDMSHYAPCSGGVYVGRTWSKSMTIETRQLNKRWYLTLTPYGATNMSGVDEEVKIYTAIQAKNFDTQLVVLFNDSEISYLDCPGNGAAGDPFNLIYEESIQYDLYVVTVRITTIDNKNLLNLGDVVFTFYKDNPEFSKMSLILKVLFLAISIGLFAFHYLKLRGTKVYWESWTDEQRLFVFLLVSLVGFNNPFYPLEFIAKSWFLEFLGSFFETVFSCILFSYWFIIAQKLRSSEYKLTFSPFLKVLLGVIVLYGVVTIIFHLLVYIREEQSPLYAVETRVSTTKVLYFVVSALYVAIVILFFATLVVTIQPINEQFKLKARFAFFAIPTVFVIISVLVALFMGILGTFGRSGPAFVFFLTMYNIYVYYLLWGFWPVEVILGSGEASSPSESTKMFVQATSANYGIE